MSKGSPPEVNPKSNGMMRNSRRHELEKGGGQGTALMNVEEQQRKAKHAKGFTPGNDPMTEKNDETRSASPREIKPCKRGETIGFTPRHEHAQLGSHQDANA